MQKCPIEDHEALVLNGFCKMDNKTIEEKMIKYRELNIFDNLQLIVIKRGFEEFLTEEQINLYANPKYNYKQMQALRWGLEYKVDINLYNSEKYSYKLMKEIYYLLANRREGYDKLTYEEKLDKINLLIIEN